MPRIPLTAPTLAWTQHDLPVFPAGSLKDSPPLVGHGKVVCYRFVQVRMPGDGAQDLRAFDLSRGKPLFALSRLRDEETVPSRSAFDAQGRVVLMESVPNGSRPGSRGLLAVLDDRGGFQHQRSFAEPGSSPRYEEIGPLQVCGGVAVATFVVGAMGFPRRVYGVPLDPGQAEWLALDSELVGVAARAIVLVERPSAAARVMARSPGGEVMWRGRALPSQPAAGFFNVRVGPRIILIALPGEHENTSRLLALDPENGKELFEREVAGLITHMGVTETALVIRVNAGNVDAPQMLDLDGEPIGTGPSLQGFAGVGVEGDRLLVSHLNGRQEYRISAYRFDTADPLWSVALPEAAMPPVLLDGGFVVRTKRYDLSVYRSPP